jgi:hypothetical protein
LPFFPLLSREEKINKNKLDKFTLEVYYHYMINEVIISGNARKSLQKVPFYIVVKLQAWVNDIEVQGLEEVRKVPARMA